MASICTTIWRPSVPSWSDGQGSPSRWVPAQHLNAVSDLANDGRRLWRFTMKESDYPGLIAEFVAGAATTILDGALATEMAAIPDLDNIPASPGAAAKIGKTVSWPTP